jgi:hypothetical protein
MPRDDSRGAITSHGSTDEFDRFEAKLRRADAVALAALVARLPVEERLQELLRDVDVPSRESDEQHGR